MNKSNINNAFSLVQMGILLFSINNPVIINLEAHTLYVLLIKASRSLAAVSYFFSVDVCIGRICLGAGETDTFLNIIPNNS